MLLKLDTGESRNLTPGKGVTAWIEKLSSDHVDEVLLRVKETQQANFEYRRFNLHTGIFDTIFRNERGFARVLFDDDWRPHVAVLQKPNQGDELWKRNTQVRCGIAEAQKTSDLPAFPDEPHDFRQPKNWVSLFAVAEQFFHEHLGGDTNPLATT